MANQEHLNLLRKDVEVWNTHRVQHPDVLPDLNRADLRETNLSHANLRKADLRGANFNGVNLSKANLSRADLRRADLRGTDLRGANLCGANLSKTDLRRASLSRADLRVANLIEANLSRANLSGANLKGANFNGSNLWKASLSETDLRQTNLWGADLSGADLKGANLWGADLTRATLVETNFTETILTDCLIYGISVWNVQLEGTIQKNLVITPPGEYTIAVDHLEVAQFIYLLLNNPKIRDVIDTIAKKAVLILGRFTPERKAILNAIRETLRQKGYLPILFDFDKPQSQDLTETVSTLAHLAKFIIVDFTSPSSAPHEVMAIAPYCIVPIQPLFHPDDVTKYEYAMLHDLQRRYHWVLPTHHYQDLEDLLVSLQAKVIAPAEQKAQELVKR